MTLKHKIALAVAVGLIGLCVVGIANAQVRPIGLNWELPTVATDGTPLTGNQVITKMQVFLNTVPIQDNTSMTPTVELGPTVLTATQSFTVATGGTVYARVRACNAQGCGPFSGQVTRTFPATVPGAPTNLTITITLSLLDLDKAKVVARLVEQQ